VATGVGAVFWGLALLEVGPDLEAHRLAVFVGAPLLSLCDLHARLHGYLHALPRRALLPVPVAPRRHHLAGLAAHGRGLLGFTALGAAAVTLGSGVALLGDFLLFVVALAIWEPLAAAAAAWFGRRFPPGSRLVSLQRSAAGGLTLPEAAVHLWAPGLVVIVAASVAMPLQLALDRLADRAVPVPSLAFLGSMGLLVGLGLGLGGRKWFSAGFFGAVPVLSEAERTLSGGPRPEASPLGVRGIASPVLRLHLLRLLRLTPLPRLRLALVGLWMGATLLGEGPPSSGGWRVGLLLSLLWVLPLGRLLRTRQALGRFIAPLPLSRGLVASMATWLGLTAPAWGPPLVVLVRWSVA
jgi:hypothetical protein